MTADYQILDGDLFDYALGTIEGVRGRWRDMAVAPDTHASFVACVGAAQTFGRFAAQPFPALLSTSLGMPVLNLGSGGKGPGYFSDRRDVLEVVNRSRACVIQVMSGRSVANPYFDSSTGRNDLGLTKSPDSGPAHFADLYLEAALKQATGEELHRLAIQIRRAWAHETYWLSRRIRVPKILFWFSTRLPEYQYRSDSLASFASEFPHFIDRRTILDVLPHFDGYVEVVSTEGLPQVLERDGQRQTIQIRPNQPTQENRYYPSPEMHALAAEALKPALQAIVEDRTPVSRTARKPQSEARAEACKPNFLVIGAAKSGTSALVAWLRLHAEIFIPPKKELHFFDQLSGLDQVGRAKHWKSYVEHFAGADIFPFRGEGTVAYTARPTAYADPATVRSYLGKVKLVYIVRRPMERLVSQWRHLKRAQPNAPDFGTCVFSSQQPGLWLDRTKYWMQIQPFIREFGENAVKVVFFDDLETDFAAAVRNVGAFLGADPQGFAPLTNLQINVTPPSVEYPSVSPEQQSKVLEYLREDIEELFRFAGRRMDHWFEVTAVAT